MIAFAESVPRALQDVLFDPQTSGGLLISVSCNQAAVLVAALKSKGIDDVRQIGEIIDGSKVLEDLKNYEKEGLKVLVCGTCLDHFSLLERKQVGETTNMLDIVTAMQLADRVISI